MPCFDGPPSRREQEDDDARIAALKHLRLVESMLCAVLTKVGVQEAVDLIGLDGFKEAGFTPGDLRLWWVEHQKQDAMRKAVY